jgi:uncharacterized protein (UPF0332 family)
MSFDYKSYFYLAQELLGETPTKTVESEAKLRSAISRAYYAVFLTARGYLEQNTPLIIPNDGTVHAFVKDQFLARGRTDGKFRRIGMTLEFTHHIRKDADYYNTIPLLQETAKAVLQRAQDALDKLGELK